MSLDPIAQYQALTALAREARPYAEAEADSALSGCCPVYVANNREHYVGIAARRLAQDAYRTGKTIAEVAVVPLAIFPTDQGAVSNAGGDDVNRSAARASDLDEAGSGSHWKGAGARPAPGLSDPQPESVTSSSPAALPDQQGRMAA